MFRFNIMAAALFSAYAFAQDAAKPQTEVLTGRVLDASGAPVEKAVVMICDDATGVPLTETARVPFTEAVDSFLDDLSYRTTEPDGSFRFEKLPKGKYKLIAQSWPESGDRILDLVGSHGNKVHLRGAASGIEVPSEAAMRVEIKPYGTGVIEVATDPIAPNDDTILLLSMGKTVADPILAFWSWGPEFSIRAIGGSSMPQGKLSVEGLPDGDLCLVVFAPDNVPGFGAGGVTVKAGQKNVISIPIVAEWGNGHHEPPEHLKALTEAFVSGRVTEDDIGNLLKGVPDDPPIRNNGDLMKALGGPSATVGIGGKQEVKVADLLAAFGYMQLKQRVAARANTGVAIPGAPLDSKDR
jgi:hypothetical protein